MLSPLPRRSDWDSICSITQPCQSSPLGSSGRSAHRHFRGLLARSLALRPAHSRRHRISRQLHRRLQLLRYLHSCSSCFRLEHLPGGVFTHWTSTALPRRTPRTAVHYRRLPGTAMPTSSRSSCIALSLSMRVLQGTHFIEFNSHLASRLYFFNTSRSRMCGSAMTVLSLIPVIVLAATIALMTASSVACTVARKTGSNESLGSIVT